MHWEAVEVLTLICGVITIVGFLILPEAHESTRLKGAGAGVAFVLYAIYAASQSSGIIVIPVGAFATAALTLFLLYVSFFGERQG